MEQKSYTELLEIPLHHVEGFSIHCIQFRKAFEHLYEQIFKEEGIIYKRDKINNKLLCFEENIIVVTTTTYYLILKINQ
jgi:hypothetical protein